MNWKDASGTTAWRDLTAFARGPEAGLVKGLFDADHERARWSCVTAEGLTLDFSRQRLGAAAFAALRRLADEVDLRGRTQEMFRGALVNPTEGRQVLHTALRRSDAPHAKLVADERHRVLRFAGDVRDGTVRSSDGGRFDLVVNIGIGGSDLGPAMAVEALRPFAADLPRVAFVSNVDGCRLADTLKRADPRRTLFIVCSKTFTTQETLTNARNAREWTRAAVGEGAIPDHFSAVSVNAKAMDEFGIHPEHRFAMWDWVGGRYSIWSSIGVSLAIAIGPEHFLAFLAGAAAVDQHFLEADWAVNVPALLGLIGAWNIDFLQLPTHAVLPYDDRLARFPAYLQQLEMESNGKRVRLDGSAVFCATAPVVWGEPGDNAQHSFFQMLHQGTPLAALDFLVPGKSSCGDQQAQDLAIANALAQAEAFAYGQAAPEIEDEPSRVPHRVHPGGRPVSLLLFERLDPRTLGKLIVLYEHKVFTQSVLWGINAFDQWGVELGKKLAQAIAPLVSGDARADSPSLAASLEHVREYRNR